MSLLDTIGSAASSILGGGITGILGVAVQRFADYKNKQLDIAASREKYAHEASMKRADAEIMQAEWAARTKVAEIETTGKIDVADSSAFAASFQTEPQRYSADVKPNVAQSWVFVILDFFRGIIRPGLTVYLCILTTLVYVQIDQKLKTNPLDQAQLAEISRLVIGTILYLTSSCCMWWFGTRNKAQPQKFQR